MSLLSTSPYATVKPDRRFRRNYQVDEESMKAMFKDFDKDGKLGFTVFIPLLLLRT
jgi:hypothetical protein